MKLLKLMLLVVPCGCSGALNNGACPPSQLIQYEADCMASVLPVIQAGMCEGIEDIYECEALEPLLEQCESNRKKYEKCQQQ